jgi:hypothetical protein
LINTLKYRSFQLIQYCWSLFKKKRGHHWDQIHQSVFHDQRINLCCNLHDKCKQWVMWILQKFLRKSIHAFYQHRHHIRMAIERTKPISRTRSVASTYLSTAAYIYIYIYIYIYANIEVNLLLFFVSFKIHIKGVFVSWKIVFKKLFFKFLYVYLSLEKLLTENIFRSTKILSDQWKFGLVSRKVFSFYFERKTLSGSCEKIRNVILFADYIKFDVQTFDCYIYFVLNICFSISSIRI